MAKKEEKSFYIGIKEPIELRKNLLEGSKMVIKSLQKYQKYKGIKQKKGEYISELKNTIKEIKKLNNDLNSKLPKTDIKVKKKVKELPKTKEERVVSDVEVKKVSEIDKLEAELSSIESKLDALHS